MTDAEIKEAIQYSGEVLLECNSCKDCCPPRDIECRPVIAARALLHLTKENEKAQETVKDLISGIQEMMDIAKQIK